MKKLAILLLVLSICGLLNAQMNDLNSGGEKPGQVKPFSNAKGLGSTEERLDSTKTENWSGTAWDLASRIKYSYSKNGNITTVNIFKNDASTLYTWQNSNKIATTVNTAGRVTLEESWEWNSGQWIPVNKVEYYYDGSGNLVEMNVYTWDTTNGWVLTYKAEYAYTDSNLTSEVTYSGTTSGLVKTLKYDFTYTNGNLTLTERSAWDGSKWERKYKYEHAYNAGGKMISEIEYRYNIDGLSFEKTFKTEFAYDSKGSTILQMGWKWDYNPYFVKDWIRVDSISNAWDASGRNIMYASFDWDKNTSSWTGSYKTETSYGEIPVSYSVRTDMFWLAASWVPAARTTSYFSSETTGLFSMGEKISVSAFPNPASDYVEFSLPPAFNSGRVELYDSGGRKILDMRMPDDRRLQVGNLDRGLYIYRIKSDGLLYTGKILVE